MYREQIQIARESLVKWAATGNSYYRTAAANALRLARHFAGDDRTWLALEWFAVRQ